MIPNACEKLCQKSSECKAWTFEARHQGPGTTCKLFTGRPEKSHGNQLPWPLLKPTATSGAKTPFTIMCHHLNKSHGPIGNDVQFNAKILRGEPLSVRVLVDRPIVSGMPGILLIGALLTKSVSRRRRPPPHPTPPHRLCFTSD